ncbi:hypothetical protein [Flavobacterium sp. SLB02]|uniref:hypothetical protein n=1 Tax=Flavobacterium sp. SLB02 TaxID=2665645 RepID=UPI0012A9763A|nr:hypothetical protein [Flavobacterium sp. SLB02]QGK72848.1 hypothetical protein GIY83_01805 [Flavobacterium sp. SLB02]
MEELALGQLHLTVHYFYSLTYRQFENTVNGFRKYEDAKSKEQWGMTRKVMYAAMAPYAKEGFKEIDVIEFPWEENIRKNISDEEHAQMLKIEKISKEFFDRYDLKKSKLKAQA